MGRNKDAVNFVGIGASHIAVSADGVHWEVVYDDSGDIWSARAFRNVAYGDGLWVLVGQRLGFNEHGRSELDAHPIRRGARP